MVLFLYLLRLAVAVMWLPSSVWACDYPAPLRLVSATLMSVQGSSGNVSPYHRARLRQALGRMDVAAMQRDMAGVLSRADVRIVARVAALSHALAQGTGSVLSARDASDAAHLATAIRTSCKTQTQAKAPSTASQAVWEHDDPQPDDSNASGLTFRQGLTRLSLIFTVYMTGLAAVIGVRRATKGKTFTDLKTGPRQPEERAFADQKTKGVSGI